MASIVVNAGMHKLISGVTGEIDWVNDTLKAMLLDDTYTPDKDHDFADDINGDEISPTGYTGGFGGAGRKSLANKSIAVQSSPTNRLKFDADDITWSSIGGASNATVKYLSIIKEITNDAASPIVCIIEATTQQTTNGSDLTWQFSADGVFRLSM